MTSTSPSRQPRSMTRMNSSKTLQIQQPSNVKLAIKRSRSNIRSQKSDSSMHSNGHSNSAVGILISQPPMKNISESLKDLRHMVLMEGIPADADGMSAIRIYIWSIFLGVKPLSTDAYVDLVHAGPSSAYAKIRDDTFRTLTTDVLFRRKVYEQSIIRLLNSFVISRERKGNSGRILYVQGMNVIAAPFLYSAKSEHEAFALFEAFVRRECPAYVRESLEGVHRGCKLVGQVLDIVDPELQESLLGHNLDPRVYAFPSCTPPLPEVCILWDFLLAYGPCLNVLCVVAQLVLMRDELMVSDSPNKLLRQFPHLRARETIRQAVKFIPRLPDGLYEEIINHTK